MRKSIIAIVVASIAVASFSSVAGIKDPGLSSSTMQGNSKTDAVNNAYGNAYTSAKNSQSAWGAAPSAQAVAEANQRSLTASKMASASYHTPATPAAYATPATPAAKTVATATPDATKAAAAKAAAPAATVAAAPATATPDAAAAAAAKLAGTPSPVASVAPSVAASAPAAATASINVSVTSLAPSTPVNVTINGVTQVTTAAAIAAVAPETQVAVPHVAAIMASPAVKGGRNSEHGHSSHVQGDNNGNSNAHSNAMGGRGQNGQRSGRSAANNF